MIIGEIMFNTFKSTEQVTKDSKTLWIKS
jgi:hypothetical protein